MAENTKIRILMVCLGNICRSPTAEVVFRQQLVDKNLDDYFEVDSAGTGSWHIGHSPDRRTVAAAASRNYDMTALRARQVTADDMDYFDYIFAMDQQNLMDLLAMCPPEKQHRITLFLEQGRSEVKEVPDPYHAGEEGFELVLDLVEEAAEALLAQLIKKHGLPG